MSPRVYAMEGKALISVPAEKIEEISYLIELSLNGNHVLFDNGVLRRIFQDAQEPLTLEQAYEVEHHLERLLDEATLEQKRTYLGSLDPITFERVVRTYFSIVEERIAGQTEARH